MNKEKRMAIRLSGESQNNLNRLTTLTEIDASSLIYMMAHSMCEITSNDSTKLLFTDLISAEIAKPLTGSKDYRFNSRTDEEGLAKILQAGKLLGAKNCTQSVERLIRFWCAALDYSGTTLGPLLIIEFPTAKVIAFSGL